MTATPERIVIDTNVIVSAVLRPHSTPRTAVLHALATAEVLSSTATLAEFREVTSRAKFDRYVPLDLRLQALNILIDQMTDATPQPCGSTCRDPKDEKFLELAVGGNATLILSGDIHLLELHPFRGIPILEPLDYLSRHTQKQ